MEKEKTHIQFYELAISYKHPRQFGLGRQTSPTCSRSDQKRGASRAVFFESRSIGGTTTPIQHRAKLLLAGVGAAAS
jgi:hypothetical protein